ncbi:MAG: hypothetical protein QM811_28250 [Pirellulales bacterium]
MIRISKIASELTPDERDTLSRLVGRDVRHDERVVVEVDADVSPDEEKADLKNFEFEKIDVLEGLSDEQIAEFDRILKYERPVLGRWEPESDAE